MRLFGFVFLAVCGFSQERLVEVSGRVVHAQTRAPLGKVLVRLAGASPKDVETLSGADGAFTLQAKPGAYTLSAHKNGYLSWTYGQRRPGGAGATLELKAGEAPAAISAGMTPGGVVAGVQLVRFEPAAGGRRYTREVERVSTDDRGQFRLHSLRPGRYLLAAALPRSSSPAGQRYGGTFYPSADTVDRAGLVEVKAGQEIEGAVIQIRPTPEVTVRGVVLDAEDGGPLHNVQLLWMPEGVPLAELLSPVYVRDPGGSFEVPSLRPGRYTVTSNTLHKGRRFAMYEKVEVRPEMEPVRLRMGPALRLTGKVKVEGEGALDLSKLIFGLETPAEISGGGAAKVDASGAFTIDNLAPGVYAVRMINLTAGYLQSIELGGRPLEEPYFILDPGSSPSVAVTLAVPGGEIHGRAQLPGGRPAPNAWVAAVPQRGGATFNRTVAAMADHAGAYRIQGLGPGEYKVYCFTDADTGIWYDAELLQPFASHGVAVQLGEHEKRALPVTAVDTAQ
jgi:uncharacterized protein (DUF2141 family)